MENKLKALKVVDLKHILSYAGQPPAAKVTKPDLIARILASPAALDAYRAIHEPRTSPSPPHISDSPAQANTAPASTPVTPQTTSLPFDAELEKRKQRAARFGIPLIDHPISPSQSTPPSSAQAQDQETIKKRAARFGITTSNTEIQNRKRPAQQDQIDPEELERRRKRAERFGHVNPAVV